MNAWGIICATCLIGFSFGLGFHLAGRVIARFWPTNIEINFQRPSDDEGGAA